MGIREDVCETALTTVVIGANRRDRIAVLVKENNKLMGEIRRRLKKLVK